MAWYSTRVLQVNDIVYFPASQFKQLFTSGGFGTLLGIADLAITFAYL